MKASLSSRRIRLKAFIAVSLLAGAFLPAVFAASNPATEPVPQKGMEERHAAKVLAAQAHRYDLLLIGDSITHGLEGPAFRAVWDHYYGSRNALDLGFGGARTENILWNLTHGELDNQSPKVVTLLIGTNNMDDANYPVVCTPEQVAEGTGAVVKLLREKLPDTKILLLRIFPRTNVYFKADGSERGNAQKRAAACWRAGELTAALADGEHVFYLDVNSVLLAPDGSLDRKLMPDLLHPSPAGALAWARAMEPLLAKLFGDQPRLADPVPTEAKVSVAKFGAIPDDERDDTPALREAIEYCRSRPGTTLVLPAGVYRLRDEKAVRLIDDIMNGVIKGDPQQTIFKPYYAYAKGLDLGGMSDLTIEAAGATLLCEGWMEPLSLSHCRNVTIRGLTIDYAPKPNSVGTITNVQPKFYEATFDSRYTLKPTMPLCRVTYWDPVARRILPPVQYFPKYELVDPHTLRIQATIPADFKGRQAVAIHTLHFRPAILLLESSRITLEDVTIHSQPGMGIVGQRSEDLTLRGVRIVPAAGQSYSTNTDATHFVSCAGTLTLENCQFEGQGDDSLNVHNYYYSIGRGSGDGYDLRLTKLDLHAGVLDYPSVGDRLELVDAATLAVVKTMVVKSRENHESEVFSRVTLDGEMPADSELDKYFLINVTRLPKIRISGCAITSCLARGFLIKGRDVVIERCLIRETTGSGIHIGAEGGWHEGPASANVIVRYNRFVRCASGAGTQDGAVIAVNVQTPGQPVAGLHKNIVIEGNIIEGENNDTGISIGGAENVTIRHNEIAGCATPIKVAHSTNVRIESNAGIPDRVVKE